MQAARAVGPARRNRCSICRSEGHNARNCPQKPVGCNPPPNRAAGAAGNAQILVRVLNGQILEDEEGKEDDPLSDGSEEGSDGSSGANDNKDEHDYPLRDSWRLCEVDALPEGASPLGVLPEFIPAGIGIGKAHDLEDVQEDSTLQHFRLFYPDIIFDKFLTATNSYGRMKYRLMWKAIDLAEFKSFLACILHLGIVKYANRRDAWSTGLSGSRFLRSIITRDRFDQILTCWRHIDYSLYSNEELNLMKADDPFWAVAEYCEVLSQQFGLLWNPGQFLDVDEQTIPWKGRHKCRNYNPNKPEKWHFKVWSLNDSSTGYQLNHKLYRGKAEQRPEGMSATAYPAYVLLQDEKYHHRGHIEFSDNFFSSFDQTGINAERGIHSVGTLRANRQGLPHAHRGKMIRGEFITKVTDWRGIRVWYTEWQDRKVVKMLHTFPTFLGDCQRNVKGNQGWEKRIFNRPTVIKLYNKGITAFINI